MPLVILIHYNEIGLKGGNRRMFEQQLQNNIQQTLDDLFVAGSSFKPRTKWQYGRLYIENFDETEWPKIRERLRKVFGIANFVLAEKVIMMYHSECSGAKRRISGALAQIQAVLEKKFLSSPTLALPILRKGEGKLSFRVTCKRAQKDFPLTSQQINEQLGEFIQQKTGARVDLKNPDITFYVEIVNKSAFVYTNRDSSPALLTKVRGKNDNDGVVQGAGGLPVGVSGRAICLISGGIDSPVAAWLAMKRGLEVYFAHFHSAPQTDTASQDKIKRLVEILNQWQVSLSLRASPALLQKRGAKRGNPKLRGATEPEIATSLPLVAPRNDILTMIPFLDFQKKALTKTPAKYRVILYRREMLRQAEKIAKKIGAKAIITGEALGQVASQTIENLAVIEQAINLPVLRPLICFDKQEIIALAQKIGTYEISTEPHQDCCSLFVPEHPATRANLTDILKIEKDLDLDV